MSRAAGGSRSLAGRRPDPIRNGFETIKTAENLGIPLQQQQLRCKICMEKVSGRPDRLKEHKANCFRPTAQDYTRHQLEVKYILFGSSAQLNFEKNQNLKKTLI